MKRLMLIALSTLLPHTAYGADGDAVNVRAATATEMPAVKANVMKIRLTIEGKNVDAALDDNATARDFLSLLPLTLTLEDYASTEKIAYPPRKLSTAGAPAGYDPDAGDIAYYAPWGNLVIFYQDFRYSDGLIRLGRIDGGVGPFDAPGSLNVRIESAGE